MPTNKTRVNVAFSDAQLKLLDYYRIDRGYAGIRPLTRPEAIRKLVTESLLGVTPHGQEPHDEIWDAESVETDGDGA